MAYNYFNPNTANDLAKFQGTMAGFQAGNASYTGVAAAPTSIYNQAGYYALQDPNTGYVHIQQLAPDSMYTQNWYDQTTGMVFDFRNNGYVTQPQQTQSPAAVNIQITTAPQQTYPQQTGYVQPTFTGQPAQNTGYVQYPWGPGYVAVNPGYGQPTGVQYPTYPGQTVEKDPEKQLSAEDLQDMVDSGIYENLEEAYNDIKSQGYWLSDKDAGKLGIYSEEDETKIKTMMDKLGCSREEAIAKLGDKISTKTDSKSDVENKLNAMMESGLSRKEAVEYLEDLGYEVPDELKTDPPKFKDADEAKIKTLMETTGCTREEAIEAIGCKPIKDGWLKSALKGVGNFFGNIGKSIADGWNAFWEWVW